MEEGGKGRKPEDSGGMKPGGKVPSEAPPWWPGSLDSAGASMHRLLLSLLRGRSSQLRMSGHFKLNLMRMCSHLFFTSKHIDLQGGMTRVSSTCSVHIGAYREQRKNLSRGEQLYWTRGMNSCT